MALAIVPSWGGLLLIHSCWKTGGVRTGIVKSVGASLNPCQELISSMNTRGRAREGTIARAI